MKELRYQDMKFLRYETEIDFNILFCSYLRQPIYAEKGETGYFIQGVCSLTGKTCLRFIDKKTKRCRHENTTN